MHFFYHFVIDELNILKAPILPVPMEDTWVPCTFECPVRLGAVYMKPWFIGGIGICLHSRLCYNLDKTTVLFSYQRSLVTMRPKTEAKREGISQETTTITKIFITSFCNLRSTQFLSYFGYPIFFSIS